MFHISKQKRGNKNASEAFAERKQTFTRHSNIFCKFTCENGKKIL